MPNREFFASSRESLASSRRFFVPSRESLASSRRFFVPSREFLASVCRALAFAAVLVSTSTAALASADSPAGVQPRLSSVEAAVEQARRLMAAGEPEKALDLLRELPREGSFRLSVLFQTGMAAVAASGKGGLAEERRDALLDEAVAALHAILVDRPDLVRVRLELARAFFLKEEDGLSRRHFEQVLAGDPPPAVAANIRRFLSVMRARRRWSAYAGAAIAPNSNINGASDEEIVYIDTAFGRLPFRRSAESRAQSGVGLSVWGGGEYQYPLGERVRLRVGADVARNEYRGSRFDRTFMGVHMGPRWLVAPGAEVSVLGVAHRQWVAGRPDNDALGARVEARRGLTPRLGVNGSVSWRRRDYRRGNALDGPVADFSLGVVWVATPTLRTRASLGYVREHTEFVPGRNGTRLGRLGAELALPLGFTLGAGAEMRWRDFKGTGRDYLTLDGARRSDRTHILRVSLLNRAFTVMGFSPQAVFVNEVLKTNAQNPGDYTRNRGELRFVRQF